GHLLAREAEQARIERLLARARGGTSDAMIIRGDAGLGKTSLLEWAVDRARGMRVLRTRGVENEAELPYSGLRELFASLAADPAERPTGGYTTALEPRGAAGAEERFGIYAAFHDLLCAEESSTPLLILVDHAHWHAE